MCGRRWRGYMVVCVRVGVCKCALCSVQCALLFSPIDHNPRKLCIWPTVQNFTLTYCPVMFEHSIYMYIGHVYKIVYHTKYTN